MHSIDNSRIFVSQDICIDLYLQSTIHNSLFGTWRILVYDVRILRDLRLVASVVLGNQST